MYKIRNIGVVKKGIVSYQYRLYVHKCVNIRLPKSDVNGRLNAQRFHTIKISDTLVKLNKNALLL